RPGDLFLPQPDLRGAVRLEAAGGSPLRRTVGALSPPRQQASFTITTSNNHKISPKLMVPGIESSGRLVSPCVPISAFSSTSRIRIPAPIGHMTPPLGVGSLSSAPEWLAIPMKNSIGIENRVLVREASDARRPAGAAAGLAAAPPAVATALAITICCFGQITNQTLPHMMRPIVPPVKIVTVHVVNA